MELNYVVLVLIVLQVLFNLVSTNYIGARRNNFVRPRRFSLVPEPSGPKYGFVFNTTTGVRLPIPGSVAGTCEKGKQYRIRSVEDLRKSEAELQCIFTSALTPSKIPVGPHQAGVLVALNARHFLVNPVADLLWKGSFAFKVECYNGDSTPSYIGFHNVAGITSLPFSLHIQKLAANLAPGEYEDNRESLFMDFADDFPTTCPDYADYVERNKDSVPTTVRPMPNVFPVTQVLDLLRFVGRQDDGGGIYLGKTYMKDYFRNDNQAATVAFWHMVCYDMEVNPEFQAGQALPPQEVGYKYIFPGFADMLLRLSPVDNAVYRPLETFRKFNEELWRTGRATYLNLKEFLRNYG